MSTPVEWWHGCAVSQEDRDRTIKQVWEELEKHPGPRHRTSSLTGDMLVSGNLFTDKDGKRVIIITDCIVRRHQRFYPGEKPDFTYVENCDALDKR